jgi:hypothetical protein
MKTPHRNPSRAARWLLFALIWLLACDALAAQRQVCFRMQLRDDRFNCAQSGETGARRACNPDGYVDMVGHQVEVWDKDWSSDDEYIGTWYIGGGGTQCIGFEWENADYSNGESNPDLYLRYINRVNRTGYSNYIYVRGVNTDDSAASNTSWRNGQNGDEDRYVAMNCSGASCSILSSGTLVPTNDIASDRGLRIMALDSAQHTLQVAGDIMDTNIDLQYPGQSDCPTSCAPDRDLVKITAARGANGSNVTHEVGHVIQMQEFNQDWLRDDCSRNGDGHSLGGLEHESCATTEGWGNYIASVSWYEPNNGGTTPIAWGVDFDTASLQYATCSDDAHNEIQTGKGWWDLDDWNDEGGTAAAIGDDDRVAYGTLDIIQGWRQFDDGGGNRDDGEDGQDGVNMRDYWANNAGRFTAAGAFETLIEHNCLQAQVDD